MGPASPIPPEPLFLRLRPDERNSFERDLASHFFRFAAPMPIVHARRLKALFESGQLHLRALGADYELAQDKDDPVFVLTWTDGQGARRKKRFDAVVDARGQSKSFSSNQSELARNLLASKTAWVEPPDPPDSVSEAGAVDRVTLGGSLWIDPDTQGLMRLDSEGRPVRSKRMYAAGPPTRGQILDASMAWSSTLAAQRIVQDILGPSPG